MLLKQKKKQLKKKSHFKLKDIIKNLKTEATKKVMQKKAN